MRSTSLTSALGMDNHRIGKQHFRVKTALSHAFSGPMPAFASRLQPFQMWTGIGELNETIDADGEHSPWRLICVDATLDEVDDVRPRLESVIHPSKTYMDFNIGAAFWLASRGEGTLFKKAESGVISTGERYRLSIYHQISHPD